MKSPSFALPTPLPPSRVFVAVLVVLAGAWPRPSLHAQEFDVDTHGDNQVRFVSKTTIQTFDGVTSKIDGYVVLGQTPLGAESAHGSQLYLEVDLASLDTGIGLRNRHMRDDYLEVKKYPYATYKGRILLVEPQDDRILRVTADGTFSVHGVNREMQIPCDVSPTGAGYRAKCSFTVLLSDYHIKIPQVMFLKVNNEIRLDLDFTVTPSSGTKGGLS